MRIDISLRIKVLSNYLLRVIKLLAVRSLC